MILSENTDATVRVVAIFKARNGAELKLREALQKLVSPTKAETGCIEYILHLDTAEPSVFVFYEIWASQADFDAHTNAGHLAEFSNVASALLAEPPSIRCLGRV